MTDFEPIEKLLDAISSGEGVEEAAEAVEHWMAYTKPVLETIHDAWWSMYGPLNLIMVNDYTDINPYMVRELTRLFLEHEPNILKLSMREAKGLDSFSVKLPDVAEPIMMHGDISLLDNKAAIERLGDIYKAAKVEVTELLQKEAQEGVEAVMQDGEIVIGQGPSFKKSVMRIWAKEYFGSDNRFYIDLAENNTVDNIWIGDAIRYEGFEAGDFVGYKLRFDDNQDGVSYPMRLINNRLVAPLVYDCARCKENPITIFVGEGAPGWCYAIDFAGEVYADFRDQEYRCSVCLDKELENVTE